MEIIEDSGTKNDFLHLAIDQVLSEVPSNDRVKIVENIFLAAANTSDEIALKWLEIYKDVSLRVNLTQDNFMVDVFPHWIKCLYLQTPNLKHTVMGLIPILKKTRTWMIEKIIIGWRPEPSPLGYELFSFILKEHRWVLEVFGSSVDFHKEERDRIPKLVKEHTGSEFTPEHLEKWMKYYPIPDDIMQVLAKAWVRNGGWKQLPRYFAGKLILDALEPEKRSADIINAMMHRASLIKNNSILLTVP